MDLLNDVPAFQQPYPFWFWNGKMQPAEIQRQIGMMRQAGITEFVVHARTGLQTPFLSEEWFDAVGAAVDEARRRGMRCWIYDEYNWPSGTAGMTITRNLRNREHYIGSDGRLQPERDQFRGLKSVDYLNPDCTREFIDKCYQPYYARFGDRFGDRFGGTIPGFFNDEVRFCHPWPWSPSLGEDVPARPSYYRRLGELIVENHFALLRRWCDEHGVLFTGHVMGEETLGSQTRYLGNAWDVIDCYSQPGIDHLGRACWGHHPRIAASVAHLHGERAVTCETFAGCPWNFTPEDLYRIAGWLYASGVTRLLFHGFFYRRDGEAARDWPPDIFFRWAHWHAVPAFVQWAGRVQHFLRRATPVCRVAVYYPHEEFCADFEPDPRFTLNFTDRARVTGENARRHHLEMGRLMNELIRRGIDFDLVPAGALGQVQDRVLIAPWRAEPDFAGQLISQGEQTAEACVDRLEQALGERVHVTGFLAQPRPMPVSDCISDPYVHEGRDDGGVLVKQFRFEGKRAIMLWNANEQAFSGELHLPDRRAWIEWAPETGALEDRGETQTCRLDMPRYAMRVLFGEL